MKNIFAEAIKKLREDKFPGVSLRRVNDRFMEDGFGEFFYTQINKIENGILLPSVDLLESILRTYKVTKEEKDDIFKKFLAQNFFEAEKGLPIKPDSIDEAFALYRKLKKK